MKIYEPKGRAREYSPLALNYYKGCTHGCVYCYVPNMIGRFQSEYNHFDVITPDEKAFCELETSARRMKGCDKQILLSFTGDPYCGISPETTTRVLEILNKYEHKVAVLSKGGSRCLGDMELIQSFGKRIKVGATLTFDNDKDSLLWESGGGLPEDRINTLRIFAENGVKTWASFEPVIIPEQSLNLILQVSDFIDHVRIGKINKYKGLDKEINWSDFLDKAIDLCRKTNTDFYIKDDLRRYNTCFTLTSNEVDQDFFNV